MCSMTRQPHTPNQESLRCPVSRHAPSRAAAATVPVDADDVAFVEQVLDALHERMSALPGHSHPAGHDLLAYHEGHGR